MRGTILVASDLRDDRERVVRAVGNVFLVRDAVPGESLAGAALVVVAADRLGQLLADSDAPRLVVFGEATELDGDPRVVHRVSRAVPIEQVRPLLLSLAERRALYAPRTRPAHDQADAQRLQRAFALSRRLAGAHDLATTEQIALDAIEELTGADRVACLFFDADDASIWSEDKLRSAAGDDRRAIAGLVGYAAATGQPASSERLSDDPRALVALDDPAAEPDARVAVAPMVGATGTVHGVLVAARSARRPRFGAGELSLLSAFASLAGPFLDHLSTQVEAQAMLDAEAEDGLFRREALEAQSLPRWGEVIRVTPRWVGWVYWLLVVLLAASVAYVSLATVATYSTGPVIVRATTRSEITARSPGNVAEVAVEPGRAVEADTVIVRLDDVDARGTVERLEREFDTQLRNHMLDPGDAAADAALRGLRLELERARLALEDRVIRTPVAGVIADLRVRRGQRVEPGDIVASITDRSDSLEAIALLPGSDRPQLSAGMPLRLELSGYRYAYQTLTIDSVSSDVIAPAEARRVLGADVADSLRLTGPVVLVRARIPGGEFQVDGATYRYHDGMQGTGEVRVRSERVLYVLIPGLRKL